MRKEDTHNKSRITGVMDDVRQYVEKRMELFALTIAEEVSFILADSIQRVIGLLLLAGGGFFAWFAAGFYMSEVFESFSLGFFSVSVPLLLVGFIFLKVKPKSVRKSIQSGIVRELLKSIDENRESFRKSEFPELTEREEEETVG